MDLDIDALSNEDFDLITDTALEIVYMQLDFVEQVTDETKANLIRRYLNDEAGDISIEMQPEIHQNWWTDASEMFETMSEANDEGFHDDDSGDAVENATDSTTPNLEDGESCLVEVNVLWRKGEQEPVIVASCLFKLFSIKDLCTDDLRNVIVQWLPGLNDLS